MLQAKYVYTHIIAHDWRKLAAFYQDVFGCIPVPPMRNFKGEVLERATNIPNAAFQGMKYFRATILGLTQDCSQNTMNFRAYIVIAVWA
jgi:hypothetical protein